MILGHCVDIDGFFWHEPGKCPDCHAEPCCTEEDGK